MKKISSFEREVLKYLKDLVQPTVYSFLKAAKSLSFEIGSGDIKHSIQDIQKIYNGERDYLAINYWTSASRDYIEFSTDAINKDEVENILKQQFEAVGTTDYFDIILIDKNGEIFAIDYNVSKTVKVNNWALVKSGINYEEI